MSNNDDPKRPDDNPFIAFRRFADSQVSSLLNTVFTLPATIANYNNAYSAREQCLFGKADKRECDKLHQLEDQIVKLRDEGRESYRVGDLQAVLEKSEDLLILSQKADHVRRNIVGNTVGREDSRQCERALVEKVANEKGQQWGDSWDWDVPRRDEDANGSDLYKQMIQMEAQMKRFLFGEKALEGVSQEPKRWAGEDRRRCEDDKSGIEDSQPRISSWSWQWSHPIDASKRDATTNERLQDVFDELGQAMKNEEKRIMGRSQTLAYDDSYLPQSLERDEKMKKAGVNWRAAYEDLIRFEQNAQSTHSHSEANLARSAQRQYPKRVPWEGEEASREPNYEYARNHDDQHDEPPSPKTQQSQFNKKQLLEQDNCANMPETELDIYERFLDPSSSPTPITTNTYHQTKPTILSTITTTERSVAPDGTVTTKIMLKKRFADGREESSETVQTQRGQGTDLSQHPWITTQEAHSSQSAQKPTKDAEKKGSWFWSN